jgi:hypothetical protein
MPVAKGEMSLLPSSSDGAGRFEDYLPLEGEEDDEDAGAEYPACEPPDPPEELYDGGGEYAGAE